MDGNPYKSSETNEIKPVVYDFFGIFTGFSLVLIITVICLRGFGLIVIQKPILHIEYEWVYALLLIIAFNFGYMIGKR